MPSRANAVVVCSCMMKIGDSARANLDPSLMEVEMELVRIRVPDMIRHWRLGHQLTGQDPAFRSIIEDAAAEIAERERA